MRETRHIEVQPEATLREVLNVIDTGRLQIALVTDADRKLLGTVTDGDIRRAILAEKPLSSTATELMNRTPWTVGPEQSHDTVLAALRKRALHHAVVVDTDGHLLGLLLLEDLTDPAPLENEVFIFAGGKGTRLRPLTESMPKPLVPVGGRPILERILDDLSAHGFKKAWLAVNYMAEQIEEAIGDGSRYGMRVDYIHEDKPLGTAGALSLLPERPRAPMLVMNADVLTALNPLYLLQYHAARNVSATMCVREYVVQVPYGVVQTDDDLFLGIEEKPVSRYFVNAGVYVLEPPALDALQTGERSDMTTLFSRLHDDGERVAVFPMREYWTDIGQHEDLERARADVKTVFDAPPDPEATT